MTTTRPRRWPNPIFHLDETAAVEPLEVTESWSRHEPPDTYPFGL